MQLKKLKKILRQILLPSIYDLFLQIYLRYTLNIGIEELPKEIENGMKQIETLLDGNNELLPLKDDYLNSNNNIEDSENIVNTENKENSLNNENTENKEAKENKETKAHKGNKEMQKELTKKYSNSKDNNNFYQGFDLSTIEQKDDFKIYFLTFLKSSQKYKPKNINEESNQKITEKEIHKMVNKYCEEATEKNHSFFNEKYDKSLGKFIVDLCQNSSTICK